MKNKENNQKWQKIKLYGSLTTKELKTKHSSRLVGGAERTCSKVAAGGPSEAADCGAGRAKLQLAVKQQLEDPVIDPTTQSSSAATQSSSVGK